MLEDMIELALSVRDEAPDMTKHPNAQACLGKRHCSKSENSKDDVHILPRLLIVRRLGDSLAECLLRIYYPNQKLEYLIFQYRLQCCMTLDKMYQAGFQILGGASHVPSGETYDARGAETSHALIQSLMFSYNGCFDSAAKVQGEQRLCSGQSKAD